MYSKQISDLRVLNKTFFVDGAISIVPCGEINELKWKIEKESFGFIIVRSPKLKSRVFRGLSPLDDKTIYYEAFDAFEMGSGECIANNVSWDVAFKRICMGVGRDFAEKAIRSTLGQKISDPRCAEKRFIYVS